MINDHKAPIEDHDGIDGEWKIQLLMLINFISSKDTVEAREMWSKSNNMIIMMSIETDDIINELF